MTNLKNEADTEVTLRQSAERSLQSANATLKAEISRRKEIEKSLRASKRRQGLLLAKSRILQGQLRTLSHQILHVQEEERKQISRDLHDEIAQSLALVNIHLATFLRAVEGSVHLQNRVIETQKLVAQSVDSVHDFAMGLRPTVLDKLGLVPALRSFAKKFSEQTKLPVDLNIPEPLTAVEDLATVALYRVAQAALSNIERHAGATRVSLSLQQKTRILEMKISDNGKGFRVTETPSDSKAKRLGLVGMRERAEMIGARFEVVSQPGEGTTVSVRLPRSEAKSAESTPSLIFSQVPTLERINQPGRSPLSNAQ